MNKNREMKFQEITERVNTLIDMADDKTLIDNYRTNDLLKLVNEEFQEIISILNSLADNDLYRDMCL